MDTNKTKYRESLTLIIFRLAERHAPQVGMAIITINFCLLIQTLNLLAKLHKIGLNKFCESSRIGFRKFHIEC